MIYAVFYKVKKAGHFHITGANKSTEGDEVAALRGSLEDDLLIERLDGADIDHAADDALGPEHFGILERLIDHQAGGDDGDIVALGELLALAAFELEGFFIVEYRNRQTAKAQIDRPSCS